FTMKKSDNAAPGKAYRAANPPFGAGITYHLKSALEQPAQVTISDAKGEKVIEMKGGKDAGLNRLTWNLKPAGEGGEMVKPGEYTVTVKVGDRTLTKKLTVEAAEQGAEQE